VSDWPERTADEREAARLERERRRAGQPAFDADPSEPIEARRLEHPPDDDGYEDEDDWVADDEVALGTRRVARRERVRQRSASTPPPAGGAGRPARTKHSLLGRVLALIFLAIAAAAIWFLVELYQPFHGSAHGRVTVTIPPHSGAQQVGDILAHDGVVSSSFFFNLRAALSGDRGKLLSGTYSLQQGMTYGAVLKALTTPPPAAKTSDLTIIEGRTRSQIDTLLRDQKIGTGYLKDTRHSPLLDPARYGAPRSTPSLEGFLFPNTYQLRDPVSLPALVADQLKTFAREFATVNLRQAESRHFTPYQVLIIASMVQAEAQTAHDRPLIASVIYNRLADHMPLQIDATTRYATGNYTQPLTQSQLASPSPYNTRVHPGLTPTPIDNPGLAAIQAAAHPASTSYLYFVVKPCGNGESAFASSYSVFQHDVELYYAARQRNGGRSPVHC
jgi:peptidoglycan lytic transglycosylase G